jgi:hypothetical protein
MTLKRFNVFTDKRSPIEERLDDFKKSKKDTPRHCDFDDAIRNNKPIIKCVYCNQPMFQVGTKGKDIVASCATPMCLGNQDTKIDPYWISLKSKMDDKLVVRNGVWRRSPYG